MDRQEWLRHMICLQALCRGYLIRKDLQAVQTEYEDVVKEVEGSLDHLSWRGTLIPTPKFTDNESALSKYCGPQMQTQGRLEGAEKLKAQAEESENCLSRTAVLVPERDEETCPSSHRDCSQTPKPPGGDEEEAWNCMALEMSCNRLQQTGQRSCRVQEVARTPEALKQHRKTLSMELLWIQQAIVSRKKYLTLRQKMGVV